MPLLHEEVSPGVTVANLLIRANHRLALSIHPPHCTPPTAPVGPLSDHPRSQRYPYNASKETGAVYGAMETALYSSDPAFKGKIRAIGVSNFDSNMLTQLAQTNPGTKPAVNQCRMTVGGYDKTTHDYCKAHGITYQAYSTLHGACIRRMRACTAQYVCMYECVDECVDVWVCVAARYHMVCV